MSLDREKTPLQVRIAGEMCGSALVPLVSKTFIDTRIDGLHTFIWYAYKLMGIALRAVRISDKHAGMM